MSVIISLAELANKFMVITNNFIKRVCDGPLVTKEQALDVVYLMFDDTVNTQLRWSRAHSRYEAAMERLLPWLRLNRPNTISDDYLCSEYDSIEVAINDLVERIIPNRTWQCWATRRIGSDVVLVCGEDYRIMDWERRMRKGEWR